MATILILGGDGFCGWPTALHLSAAGHDVVIADNFARRNADVELEAESLTPIRPLGVRRAAWAELTGRELGFHRIDVAKEYDMLRDLLAELRPDAVVHFAEQRAAPYSMKSPRHKRYTVDNNVNATTNLLTALVETELDAHVVHLGTMGVYGYGGGAADPRGLPDRPHGRRARAARSSARSSSRRRRAASTTSRRRSTSSCWRSTTATTASASPTCTRGSCGARRRAETRRDERLINRFDYDGDYGTVLNRFLMQAAIGYPLTVHGTGGQTRAFIHLQDSVRCIQLAIEHPPEAGERVRIFNQMTEIHRVIDLAELVGRITGASIDLVDNPRKEAAENDLTAAHQGLVELGLDPITLEDALLTEVMEIAVRYRDRCDVDRIPCRSRWVNRKPGVPA